MKARIKELVSDLWPRVDTAKGFHTREMLQAFADILVDEVYEDAAKIVLASYKNGEFQYFKKSGDQFRSDKHIIEFIADEIRAKACALREQRNEPDE